MKAHFLPPYNTESIKINENTTKPLVIITLIKTNNTENNPFIIPLLYYSLSLFSRAIPIGSPPI